MYGYTAALNIGVRSLPEKTANKVNNYWCEESYNSR